MKCIKCEKELKKRQKKFCSIQCQKDYEYEQYIIRWLDKKESGLRGKYSLSRHIKRYMLEKAGYKCERCGWNERNPYTGNIPLEIEHIDGNYLNNSPDNLVVLCPNCHSLTGTYKGANKGYGRKDREQYYVN